MEDFDVYKANRPPVAFSGPFELMSTRAAEQMSYELLSASHTYSAWFSQSIATDFTRQFWAHPKTINDLSTLVGSQILPDLKRSFITTIEKNEHLRWQSTQFPFLCVFMVSEPNGKQVDILFRGAGSKSRNSKSIQNLPKVR